MDKEYFFWSFFISAVLRLYFHDLENLTLFSHSVVTINICGVGVALFVLAENKKMPTTWLRMTSASLGLFLPGTMSALVLSTLL